MQAIVLPAAMHGAVIGTYRLDQADLVPGPGAQESMPATVAALWSVVRRVDTARIMVLHHRDRLWVATGSLLVEGQKGLNVGFLMPTLRAEMTDVEGAGLPPVRLEGDARKVLWGLAARIARVEEMRVFLLDTGEVMPIRVSRDGFALPSGIEPGAVRSAIHAAIEAGRSVRYSLGEDRETGWGPQHCLATLFGDTEPGPDIRIAGDLWPASAPEAARLEDFALALTLADQLAVLGPDPDGRLVVLGATAQPLATVTKDTDAWVVRVQQSKVR